MNSVLNAQDVDVTDEYIGKVDLRYHNYLIKQRTITIETASDTKSYDGEALSNDTLIYDSSLLVSGHIIQYEVIGSQTKVGDSLNIVDFDNGGIYDEHGTNVTRNYKIIWVYGTLTVTV